MFKIRSMNNKGFTQHLIVAVLVVVGVAGFGAWRVYSTHALTVDASTCGSGYTLILAHQSLYPNSSTSYGQSRVQLYLNTSAKKLCALNVATGSSFGVGKYMSVSLQVGTNYQANSGTFKYYAGPVYLSYSNTTTQMFTLNSHMKYNNVDYTYGDAGTINMFINDYKAHGLYK